jgi:thiamine biosynthesis lipoprotein
MFFEALGTQWHIQLPQHDHYIEKNIMDRIDLFDVTYSRFRTDSFLSRITTKPGTYTLPDDAKILFDFYMSLNNVTNGLVTPLIGRTMEEAGYDASYSFAPKKLHHPPAWNEALIYAFPSLTIKQPVTLDFGAAGKGYLVDLLVNLLRRAGITKFVINAGGDIFCSTEEDIGLEDPDDYNRVLGTTKLHNQALCGSAGNRRTWSKFHHIINPQTLTSPRNITAVWVKAPSTMVADGLATALFFVPPEKLTAFTFEYVMIEGDTMKISPHFNARLFTEQTL